jgi:hypothetical protein
MVTSCILNRKDIEIINRVLLQHHEEHEHEDDTSTGIVNSSSLIKVIEKLEDCDRTLIRIKKRRTGVYD